MIVAGYFGIAVVTYFLLYAFRDLKEIKDLDPGRTAPVLCLLWPLIAMLGFGIAMMLLFDKIADLNSRFWNRNQNV